MRDSRTRNNGNDGNRDLIGSTYARISTAKQKDGISLADQDTRMSFYSSQNDIYVPEEYRFKEQESGFKEERSEYDKIRQLVRERRINVLIIYGSDRHTRDPIHGEIFRAELRRNNVSLHIITEGGEVDIISPTGQYIRRQMDNFNWYWGKMIQQTTQDKKKAYTEAGVPLQQGFAKFGFKRVGKQGDATLEIVEDEARIALDVFRWYGDDGQRVLDICRLLRGTPTPGDLKSHKSRQREYGVWSEEAIYQMLNDEIYAGVYYANRFTTIEDEHGKKKSVRTPREEWIPIAVPAIVPRDLWERCQERLARGRTEAVRGHGKYNYLLARRATCRICEYAIVGNTGTKRKAGQAYYFCRSKRFDVIREGCDMPYFRVDDTDYTVWEFIKRLLSDPRAMLASMQEAQEVQRKRHADLERRIAEVDELIAQHQNDLDELVRDYRKARSKLLYETLERQAQEVEEQITGLRNRREQYLAQLNERVLSDQEIQSLEEFAAEVRPKLPMADYALKRMIIERLNFYFQLTIENGQRVVYIIWLTYEFPEPIEGTRGGRRGSSGQPGSGNGGNHADMASFGGLENVLR